MQQDLGFLEAIRRRPGLRQDRLVYADWLEERGDPRGNFIRLQCHASRLARWAPRRLALEAEAHQLLLKHEADWLGPLLGAVSNWEFRGGLLEWVTVTAETFLANADKWLPMVPLLGVHLRKARAHVAALAACPQLAYLHGLYLGDNDLTDADLRVLLRSPHLHHLRKLYLQKNKLTTKGARALATSPHLPHLRDLDVAGNHIEDDGVQALGESDHLQRLRRLNLTLTQLRPPGVQALASSPLLGRLHTLLIDSNFLPPGALKALAESPRLARLRALHADMNDCSDADVEALAGSPHVQDLRALALTSNHSLGDNALKALAASPHLQRLRTLDFGHCSVGRKGIAALGRSRTLKSLRCLGLVDGEKDPGPNLAAFLRGPLVRQLRVLWLTTDDIRSDSLTALASHPAPLRLRQLYLPLGKVQTSKWETLWEKGTFSGLTDLTVSDLRATFLDPLLVSGRLPELRKLSLVGLPPGCDEIERFLKSPLLGQLHHLALSPREETDGDVIVRCLVPPSPAVTLHSLNLSWSLTLQQVQALTARSSWPQLTTLAIGARTMGTEGARLLADWPVLRQLRELRLWNSSYGDLAGLTALADSPNVTPLLRVDLQNAGVSRKDRAVLREHFGARFSAAGRKLPHILHLGSWGDLRGEDD